jgi:hypothetical protein
MTQWWDTPSPTASRPSHTACTDRICWARAMGWRGCTGTTAVPISIRLVSAADDGGGGEGIELVGDLGDPDRRQTGLLGPAGVGHGGAPPWSGSGHARGRSSCRSARLTTLHAGIGPFISDCLSFSYGSSLAVRLPWAADAQSGQCTVSTYLAVNRRAPSSRMFSPLRYGLRTIDSTSSANSSG